MHLILTGATGLVGASVLHNMLAQESITHISILSRRPVAMAEGHEKAKVILHKDYKTYDKALLDELKDAQGCVWAQGISQNAVSKECANRQKTIQVYTMLTTTAESTWK
jgi:malate/lactate dehydrogenase